jgi:hypothetical protein
VGVCAQGLDCGKLIFLNRIDDIYFLKRPFFPLPLQYTFDPFLLCMPI